MKKLIDCNILVVDDMQINLDLIVAALKDICGIMIATSGYDAFLILEECLPDLILLDIMMPGMDGFEVCKKLKADERTSKIPVIFLTGNGEVENKSKAFENGAVDYVLKPFEIIEIRARVKTHLSLKLYQEALEDHNRKLEQEVLDRTTQLRDTLMKLEDASFETIVRLSKAAEYRDDDTGNHVLRVSHYTALLARCLNLGEEKVRNLRLAAPMHDIGKIGIPDNILLKPAKLNEQEWAMMKTHTIIGAKILEKSGSKTIQMAEQIALSHHEKWNGKGYPEGLIGKQIPIGSRIVAIADVFDAMISARPYKKAMSIESAFEFIRSEKGEHFDPDIVDVFFECSQDILRIKEKFEKVKDLTVNKSLWLLD